MGVRVVGPILGLGDMLCCGVAWPRRGCDEAGGCRDILGLPQLRLARGEGSASAAVGLRAGALLPPEVQPAVAEGQVRVAVARRVEHPGQHGGDAGGVHWRRLNSELGWFLFLRVGGAPGMGTESLSVRCLQEATVPIARSRFRILLSPRAVSSKLGSVMRLGHELA